MTLMFAIALIESYLDGESQSGRLDKELIEAFDILLEAARRDTGIRT